MSMSVSYLNAASRCLGLSSPRPVMLYSTFKMSHTRSLGSSPLSTASTPKSTSTTATDMTPPPPPNSDIFSPHFLVISLGNPAPYADSLHSAGHIALQSLQQRLGHDQPNFASERIAKKATQASRGPKYTLLQCPTLMNVSGPWVAKAWRDILAESTCTSGEQQHPAPDRRDSRPLGLVVVHDDLEEDMCIVKVRKWDRSHRGHNGLKSIMALMRQADHSDCKWAKISLGIGRPGGRDHDTVSDYVLKPMSKYQKATLSENSASHILAALHEIEATWRAERDNNNDTTSKAVKKEKKERVRNR